MKLSIVIPCYNERHTIRSIVEAVRAAPVRDKEIIVVDDCSTDGTRERLQLIQPELGFTLLLQAKNRGKGAALRAGFARVVGDIVVIQDADLEYGPADYSTLLHPLLEGKADVVYGSRFLGSGPHRVLYYWHSVGNWLLTLISNALTSLNMSDMETCYKVFRRSALGDVTLKQNRFGFEPELTAKIARRGLQIYEMPVRYAGRSYAEGKKIRLGDALSTVWCIVRYGLAD